MPLRPPDGVRSIQLEDRPLFDDSGLRPLEMFGHVDEDDATDDRGRADVNMVARRQTLTSEIAALRMRRVLPRGLSTLRQALVPIEYDSDE